MVGIGDSLSDLASYDEGEDVEDEEDKVTQQGQLSKDNEPGWVMGTITKTVKQLMERFRQKQMKLDELTQQGWEDAADCFHERDKKYGTSTLRIPAVVQPQTDDDAAAHAPITIRERMEYIYIDPRISQMLQGTFRPGSSDIRLGSGEPQSNMSIFGLPTAAKPHSSLIQNAKPVELVSFYPCIYPNQLITI